MFTNPITSSYINTYNLQKSYFQKKSVVSFASNETPVVKSVNKLGEKCDKLGWWKTDKELWNGLYDEIDELKLGIEHNDAQNKEEELGDVLFVLLNIARRYKIDPQKALTGSVEKINNRFEEMQKISKKPLESNTPKENNTLWKKAKEIINNK